ncbi:hypothetical protein [Longibacter salinarum]|uniref:hypothetical protein n=1 Tax=Longibacter salinarum TaxID=1850348 RepID=UPI001FE30C11|nr:hypothetical protein [Longibacter salinarum]
MVVGAIASYLVYQLSELGWRKLWTSLPTTPAFYILLVLMYVTLPVTEAVIYGKAWEVSSRKLLPVLFRKRVLNNDVLGYSGEAYFFLWMQRNSQIERRRLLTTIKDNMIISSVASTSVAFLLLAAFFLSGQVQLLEQYLPDATSTLAAAVAIIIVVVAVGLAFRRAIFSLSASLLGVFALGHLARFVFNNGFQVTQWALVIPEVPLGTWITLLSLYIIINQVPLIPARGLFFVTASVELAGTLEVPAAAVASMLLAQNLIDRGLNFLVYIGTTAAEATGSEPTPDDETAIPEEIR